MKNQKTQSKINAIIEEFERKFGRMSSETKEEFKEAIEEDYMDSDINDLTLHDAVEIFDASGLEYLS